MSLLRHFVPRNLAVRKARTLLTTLGIAFGVAAIVATGVTQDSAARSLADMFDQAAGRADLAVTNAVAGIVGGEGFDAEIIERVREVDGVQAAAPLLQVATLPVQQLNEWEMSLTSGNFNGAVVYGVAPQASREMGHYRLLTGADLNENRDDAILLTKHYAEELGLELGDELALVAPAGQVRFTVTGFLTSDGLARLNHGQVGITTLMAAQRGFKRSGRLDQIDVLATGTDTDELKTRLQATLGPGFRVFHPASKGALIDQILSAFLMGIGLIDILTLVVGSFLIYNTFATTVAERTRELGLLRALGAGRGQIAGLVLAEAALLGLVGAGLGLLLGLGLAIGMKEMAGSIANSEFSTLAVSPRHVILGLGVGLVLALVAGLIPALRAGRIPVVEAIQQHREGDGKSSRRQWIAGLALAVPSAAAKIAYSLHLIDIRFEMAYLIIIALLVGVGLLIPVIIPPLEQLTGAVLGVLGVEGRLGGRNLARSPSRSALTAGALMFGLGSALVVGGVMESAANFGQDYIDKNLSGDFWVYSPQPMPHHLTADLEALPEIQLARPYAILPTWFTPSDPDAPEIAMVYVALDPLRSERLDFSFAPDGGRHEEALTQLASGGAVLISSPLREWYGLDVGGSIRLQTLDGPVDFAIVGITLDPGNNGFRVIGTWVDAVRYFDTDRPEGFVIHVTPGIDVSVAIQRILDGWGDTYNLRIETSEELRARGKQYSEGYIALTNATMLVSIAVAVLGVVNTLLINLLERRREIGTLRSLGMTRGQVLRLILAESAAMGVLGGVLGIGLGIWLSRFAVDTSASFSGFEYPYAFPVRTFIACVVIALAVPPLAGLWPGWRGANTNIVAALRSE